MLPIAALAQSSPGLSWLPLVPWPQEVQVKPGALKLDQATRIVVGDASLRPLGGVLAEEIVLLTGSRLSVISAPPARGDIVLSLDPSLKGEAYTVAVSEQAMVRGGNYGAVALGTVSLLQAMRQENGTIAIPFLTIADAPKTEYRGLMVDVARRYHSIESLKQMVQLCRLYKIRYLQLHLTDDQAFMFPSQAFPLLSTKNQQGGKTYTLAQLQDLVAYADARNVTIVPEYEVPGHSAAANRAMPDLFLIKGTKPYEHHASINFAKQEVMDAVATIVGEMCAVFKSSPYFHIGGDEADLALANQNADFKAAFQKYNLPDQHQLYRKFVADMNELVKKNGKRMIVWEGFGREKNSPIQIPKDVVVMAYEIRFYMPDHLIQDGYQVINASWTPLYVVGHGRAPAEIFAWNARQFKPFGAKPSEKGVVVPDNAEVLGAQFCAWEQSEMQEVPNERYRVPAMAERIWNPAAGKTYEDFARRLQTTDRLLDLLAHQLTVQVEGLSDPFGYQFNKTATLSCSLAPTVQGVLRYTLDGKDPTNGSPACAGPIEVSRTTPVKIQAFAPNGQPLGSPRYARYELQPIQADFPNLLSEDRFAEPSSLNLKSTAGGEIRYTLDGKEPTVISTLYAGPIKIENSTRIKAGVFVDGKRLGEVWSGQYTRVNYQQNLTTGKPVTASGVEAGYVPEYAVDGVVDLDEAWWAGPYPQWLQVDLGKEYKIRKFHVFPFWGGGRCYQYTLEVSRDGRTWSQAVDMSQNKKPSMPQGDVHEFRPLPARYVRINMLRNSANQGVHLVELRAYE